MNATFNWAQLARQVQSLAMDPLTLPSNGAFKVLLMAGGDAATPLLHHIDAAAASPGSMSGRVWSSVRFSEVAMRKRAAESLFCFQVES